MKRTSILKLIAWLKESNLILNELQFFEMAYFDTYQKAEPRCAWCFDLYIRKGIVPLFVRSFIQKYLVVTEGKTIWQKR